MVQWINHNQNNGFGKLDTLPLLCEKSEGILLVLVGLTGRNT